MILYLGGDFTFPSLESFSNKTKNGSERMLLCIYMIEVYLAKNYGG